MAGDEQKKESSPRSTSPVATTAKLTIPHEASGKTRATSPSILPAPLVLKARTQVGRFESLKTLHTKIPTHAHLTSLDEVNLISAHVEEVHQAFCKEHDYFETVWPVKCLDHEYFELDVAVQERQLALELKIQLNRLKEDVQAIAQAKVTPTSSNASRASKLPEIALPTFSGSYVDWPTFSELFTSLIINDTQLMEIDRLHYLRSCLKGEPARYVNSQPLRGQSFKTCWDHLTKRFSNKRVLIQEQLDKLLNLPQISSRTATALTDLTATIDEVNKTLKALGAAEEMHNCILVHMATNSLDKNTREAWETSVGKDSEYPRYEQLESFIESKAVALEMLEAATQKKSQAHSAAPSRPAQRKSAHAATQPPQKAQVQLSPHRYSCDCCQEDHFIVRCPKFRGMTVEERRKLIKQHSLCRNCCGRHKVEVCKSAYTCKTCGKPHHTMLHSTTTPAQTNTPAHSLTSAHTPSQETEQ